MRSLANWAKASGIPVWFDEDTVPLRTVDGSPIEDDAWREQVRRGIAESDYVLLFTNAAWIASDPCCWEFETALSVHSQTSGKVLQICIPDERERFPRHEVLRRWEPTHVWSSCEAFAAFIQGHCGVTLDDRYSPETLGQYAREWKTVTGFLSSVRLPPFQRISRGVSSYASWPHRVMFAYAVGSPIDSGQADVKLSENPYQALLVDRVPDRAVLAAQQPRDEQIQRAYRA